MTGSSIPQSTLLVWILAFLLMITSGPIIFRVSVLRADHNNLCSFDNKLMELEFLKKCNFTDVTDSTWNLWIIVLAALVFVILVSIVETVLSYASVHNWIKALLHLFFLICSFVIFGVMVYCYISIYNSRLEPKNTNWSELHTDMKNSLVKYFKTDNVSSENQKSNKWNILFITYECCGVDRVYGTTNDFDNTSWCTTSGSCQATASQIPKSCCKNQNEFDYQTAPSICHASVNPGTFNEKGCYSVIKKQMQMQMERQGLNRAMDEVLKPVITVMLVMVSYAIWWGTSAIILFCSFKSKEDNDQDRNQTRNNTEKAHKRMQKNAVVPLQENSV